VSGLNFGAQGQVVLAVDPATGRFGSIASSGGVNLVQGSKIGLDIQSKLTAPLALTLITAPSAQLQSQVALGDVPYFYNATLVQSAAAGTIGVQVRRRTAAEAGITVGAPAYDAIFQQHDKDVQLGQAFSRAVNQASFKTLYERMLPSFAGGQFYTLSQGVDALVRAQGEDQLNLRPARDGFWVQPFGFGASRDRDQAPGFRGGGYGLAIGWEKPNTSIGTYGFSISSLRAWVDDKDSDPDNRTVSNSYLIGAYWQESGNGINVTASVNGGYVNSGSTRKLTSTDANDASFTRNAEARWGGLLGTVRAAVSYKADLWGSFYARPRVAASYLILQENEHVEHGTSDGFNLQLASRNSSKAPSRSVPRSAAVRSNGVRKSKSDTASYSATVPLRRRRNSSAAVPASRSTRRSCRVVRRWRASRCAAATALPISGSKSAAKIAAATAPMTDGSWLGCASKLRTRQHKPPACRPTWLGRRAVLRLSATKSRGPLANADRQRSHDLRGICMLKPSLLLLVAALAVAATPAVAQTTPAPAAGAEKAGAGSTPPAAFLRTVEKKGYTDVNLTADKARGGWTGTATKAGKQVRLHLAPNGNSRELKAPKPKAS
jgi:hypothetical protein